MTVKYRIEFSESDIFVLEKGDGFHLTICSRNNPLGFGNKLAVYGTIGKAIDAAEKFNKMYALTKKYGYHLDHAHFVKDGAKPIYVPELLETDITVDAMREKLELESLTIS